MRGSLCVPLISRAPADPTPLHVAPVTSATEGISNIYGDD